MTVDRTINFLATITLFEMMVTIGLGVVVAEVVRVAKGWGRLAPAAALSLYIDGGYHIIDGAQSR